MHLDWWHHPETLVCGVRGHVVLAADVADVAPEWSGLVTVTADGVRLARCARCLAWLPAPAGTGALTTVEHTQVPRRDRTLRQAILLRAIAVERAVHSVIFGLVAIGLLVLRADLPGLQSQARQLTRSATSTLAGPGQTASRNTIQHQIDRLLNARPGTLGLLAVTALVYCVVEGTEAVGLWLEKRWAEYLTALATAGFLPFEIDELLKRVTVVRLGALVVNVAVLIYLVWAKHLFGIGRAAEAEEDRVAALRELLSQAS